MANTVLMPSIIAAESLLLLDNALVMANQVYREYEGEYMKSYNGYKPGDTITIRRPTDFTVRVGAVATTQDVVEGSTNIVVNQQIGIDFQIHFCRPDAEDRGDERAHPQAEFDLCCGPSASYPFRGKSRSEGPS
jgi:hypothetical protein